MKGGGDTITKLDELNQDKLGIRSKSTVASAWILMNFAVVYHRFLQMLSTKKNLHDYPTLYHYRNAANHRFSMNKSLNKLHNMLLVQGTDNRNDGVGLDGAEADVLEIWTSLLI